MRNKCGVKCESSWLELSLYHGILTQLCFKPHTWLLLKLFMVLDRFSGTVKHSLNNTHLTRIWCKDGLKNKYGCFILATECSRLSRVISMNQFCSVLLCVGKTLVFAPTLTPISEIGLYSLIVLLPKQQFRVTYTKLLHFDFTVMSSLSPRCHIYLWTLSACSRVRFHIKVFDLWICWGIRPC